jgi:hypothetical protein
VKQNLLGERGLLLLGQTALNPLHLARKEAARFVAVEDGGKFNHQ